MFQSPDTEIERNIGDVVSRARRVREAYEQYDADTRTERLQAIQDSSLAQLIEASFELSQMQGELEQLCELYTDQFGTSITRLIDDTGEHVTLASDEELCYDESGASAGAGASRRID